MKILADTHTHTIASGHAYSTVDENARWAAEQGLRLLALTDHAPAMQNTTCHENPTGTARRADTARRGTEYSGL